MQKINPFDELFYNLQIIDKLISENCDCIKKYPTTKWHIFLIQFREIISFRLGHYLMLYENELIVLKNEKRKDYDYNKFINEYCNSMNFIIGCLVTLRLDIFKQLKLTENKQRTFFRDIYGIVFGIKNIYKYTFKSIKNPENNRIIPSGVEGIQLIYNELEQIQEYVERIDILLKKVLF